MAVQDDLSLLGADPAAAELRQILDEGLLRSVYQPIVRLDCDEVCGYEALVRGPAGSPLELPDCLFAAAERAGAVSELDWACRLAAMRGALDAGLRPPMKLFINVEPSALGVEAPAHARPLLDRAAGLDVIVELTERALADSPATVVAGVERLRGRLGRGIALDDVGADRRSLALMPFVRPDVIKLDLRLVQSNPTPEIASIVHAVSAEAERSGAVVLAEGIETEQQREVAAALGATHGQGWLFGRPGPLPRVHPAPSAPLPSPAPPPSAVEGRTPYDVVAAHQVPRRGAKRLLLAISRHLEAQVAAQGDAAVVLATFQDARHFTGANRGRYAGLAKSAAFVGALGAGLTAEPAPGVRGSGLESGDRLRDEWSVTVVAPHFAAAFTGRDLGDAGPDMDRRYDFCLTYDREVAVRAAEALMRRIAPR